MKGKQMHGHFWNENNVKIDKVGTKLRKADL